MFGLFNTGQAMQGQNPQMQRVMGQLQQRPQRPLPERGQSMFDEGHQAGIGQPQHNAPLVPEWNGPQHLMNTINGPGMDARARVGGNSLAANPTGLMHGGAFSMFRPQRSGTPLGTRNGVI